MLDGRHLRTHHRAPAVNQVHSGKSQVMSTDSGGLRSYSHICAGIIFFFRCNCSLELDPDRLIPAHADLGRLKLTKTDSEYLIVDACSPCTCWGKRPTDSFLEKVGLYFGPRKKCPTQRVSPWLPVGLNAKNAIKTASFCKILKRR